jgi:hypothetical protein
MDENALKALTEKILPAPG